MRISFGNFNNFNIASTVFKGNSINNSTVPLLSPLPCDTFQKTEKVNETKSVSEIFSNKKIEKLYDEVFDIVVEQNPIAKELNMPKPKINFSSELDSSWLGQYEFSSNSITINNILINEDWYILVAKDKEGNDIPFKIAPESSTENLTSAIKADPDCVSVSKVKLSNKEKEMWQKSIIAHELRHWIQNHMIASLNGGLDKLNKTNNALIDTYKEIINLYKEDEQIMDREEYNKYLKKLQDIENSYALNFKPHKILDDNTKLKLSIDPNDSREWSLKEHIEKSRLGYDNSNNDIYYSTPTELDAYYYEEEFIKSQYKGHGNEYSDNAILAMMLELSSQYKGIDDLAQNGYMPI